MFATRHWHIAMAVANGRARINGRRHQVRRAPGCWTVSEVDR